jgi:hypothetical protein
MATEGAAENVALPIYYPPLLHPTKCQKLDKQMGLAAPAEE